MPLFNSLNAARRECSVSQAFPITHLNSPCVFESNALMVGSTIKLEGVPFVTEIPETLNALKHTWHRAVLGIDEHYAVYLTVHRHLQNLQLAGDFNSAFTTTLNDRYQAQFSKNPCYRNDIYLTILYKGFTSGKAGKGLHWLKGLSNRASKQAREVTRNEHLKHLHDKVQQLLASLAAFKPRLLGSCDHEVGHSELLAFLGLVINGGKGVPFAFTPRAPALANSIKDVPKIETRYPHGNLGQYLSQQQLFFGDAIQFQGATLEDKRFGAMLSIKQYPTSSASLMFHPLLHLDSELILTHSFIPEDSRVALHHIQLQRAKLTSSQDKAVSQTDALEDLEDVVASGHVNLGYHHHTLMLLQDSKAQLELAVQQAVKAYARSGTAVVRETLGQEAAFWAQIPCNHHYIARAALITSENFTDFQPLHHYPSGYRDNNHLGSAATLLMTPSRTPVFFNYHVKGTGHNPSKGHALIIGGNNSGKTTFATFVDAQMEKYQGRTFYLDRDRGAELYIRASGGVYLTLSPAHANACRQNPLQLPDTADNRQFLKEWLQQLVKRADETIIPSDVAECLSECIDYCYEQLQPQFRQLSHAVSMLPIDFPRWPELRRWLHGSGKYADGDYAWLFDNPEDCLPLTADKVGFDMTYLMDSVAPSIATPVYLYLLHRMKLCLDGRLTTIIIDEGWQVLLDPFWVKYLQKWLPTIRKKNSHLILMTQSPETIAKSPVCAELLDNNATMVLFANPLANAEIYVNILKLTPSELACIQSNTAASRLFLYKQEKESMLCQLDLSALGNELKILSGNETSVRLLDSIRQEVGDDPELWLPIFYERSQK